MVKEGVLHQGPRRGCVCVFCVSWRYLQVWNHRGGAKQKQKQGRANTQRTTLGATWESWGTLWAKREGGWVQLSLAAVGKERERKWEREIESHGERAQPEIPRPSDDPDLALFHNDVTAPQQRKEFPGVYLWPIYMYNVSVRWCIPFPFPFARVMITPSNWRLEGARWGLRFFPARCYFCTWATPLLLLLLLPPLQWAKKAAV